MSVRPRARLDVQLGLFCTALLALTAVFAARGIPAWLPRGPLTYLGVPSPLTGMTRSFVALARGDLGWALHWHPLGPAVFAGCVVAACAPLSPALRSAIGRLTATRTRRRTLIALGAIAVAASWARQIVVHG